MSAFFIEPRNLRRAESPTATTNARRQRHHPALQHAQPARLCQREPARRRGGHAFRHEYRLRRSGPTPHDQLRERRHRHRLHLRSADLPPDRTDHHASAFPANQQTVQDLAYAYDPVGNITHIEDDADIQNTVFFRNRRVDPSADYTYDAIYRLIEATGREQLGLAGDGTPLAPAPSSYNDVPRAGLLQPGDGNAMGIYDEQYQYDAVGNFLQFIHRGIEPRQPRLDAFLHLQRTEPARCGANEQPAQLHDHRRQPALRREVQLRSARQHDLDAAAPAYAMGLSRPACS